MEEVLRSESRSLAIGCFVLKGELIFRFFHRQCCKISEAVENPIHFKITFFSNKGTEQFNILTTPSFFIGFSSSLEFPEINHQERASLREIHSQQLKCVYRVCSVWFWFYHLDCIIILHQSSLHTNRVVFQCLLELVLTTSFYYCSRI